MKSWFMQGSGTHSFPIFKFLSHHLAHYRTEPDPPARKHPQNPDLQHSGLRLFNCVLLDSLLYVEHAVHSCLDIKVFYILGELSELD